MEQDTQDERRQDTAEDGDGNAPRNGTRDRVGSGAPGFYDVANRKAADAYGRVEYQDVEDDQYHTHKVATAPLHSQMYLWVAPAKNPDNLTAIWVDRFWLVREE